MITLLNPPLTLVSDQYELYPSQKCNGAHLLLLQQVRKASNTLNNVLQQREQLCECDGMRLNDLSSAECQISRSLWKGAEGLVFITVAKVGQGLGWFWGLGELKGS